MFNRNKLGLVALLVLALMVALVPASAQDDAPPVLILPIDGVDFLSGQIFDLRVEVHADALPENFGVTVNGMDASEFFGGAEPTEESWEFGSEDDPTPSSSVIWRNLVAPAPGEYTVSVVAGDTTETAVWNVRAPQPGDAQNVILFIADGGSAGVYTAARLVSRGQTAGRYNDLLSFDEFEEIGLVMTSGIDSIITDSANSASSYNTGHKSAVNGTGIYPDTSPDTLDDPRVETFAEMIKRTRGMAVGTVTTADWSDATPAAVFAHGRVRTGFNRADYVTQALDGGLLGLSDGIQPDVILGGGGRYMLPQSADGSRRPDDRDMFTEYEEAGYTVVTDASGLDEAVSAGSSPLIGIFHISDMNVWLDRNVYTDNLGDFPNQPGLVDMTVGALEVLSQNPNGFYLQVESASIDKQLHPMDFERAIADTIEFEQSIAATIQWLDDNGLRENTLVIVTADHAHSFDVFGTVDTVAFNEAEDLAGKQNAIGIYNGAGFPDYADEDGDFYPDSWDVETTLAWGKVENPPYTEDYQVSPVPRSPSSFDAQAGVAVDNPEDDPNGIPLGGNLPAGSTSSVHTLQDVPVYATGPGADCLGRVIENFEIFYCMAGAIGLDPGAEDGMATMSADEGTLATAGFDMTVNIALVLVLMAGVAGGWVVGRVRREAAA